MDRRRVIWNGSLVVLRWVGEVAEAVEGVLLLGLLGALLGVGVARLLHGSLVVGGLVGAVPLPAGLFVIAVGLRHEEEQGRLTFHQVWPDLLTWLIAITCTLLFFFMLTAAAKLNDGFEPGDPANPNNSNHFKVTNNSRATFQLEGCDSPRCFGQARLAALKPGGSADFTLPWTSSTSQQWLVLRNASDVQVGCVKLNNHRRVTKTKQILVGSFRPCPP